MIMVLKVLKRDIKTNTIHVTAILVKADYFKNAVMEKLESEGFKNERQFNKVGE